MYQFLILNNMKKIICFLISFCFYISCFAQLNVTSDMQYQNLILCKSKKYGNYELSLRKWVSAQNDNVYEYVITCSQTTNRFDSRVNYIKLGENKEQVIESLNQLIILCKNKKTDIYVDNDRTHITVSSMLGKTFLAVKTSPNAGQSYFYKENLERFLKFMNEEFNE